MRTISSFNQEHPHYIAVSNTNRVIVSDSNNHRIQVRRERESENDETLIEGSYL